MNPPKNINLYNNLKNIFNRNQKIFEVLYLYHDLKDVARLSISEEKLETMKNICKIFNLKFETQDYKIKFIVDKGKGSFSNTLKRVPKGFNSGLHLVYISKNEEKTKKAKKFENNENSMKFGELLGYPECCTKFFKENKREQSKKQMDFVLPALDKLEPFPYVNNVCFRYFGPEILSHFPCSFDCEKSKELGSKYLEIIEKYNPELEEYYTNELKSFVLYTEYSGVFASSNYAFDGETIKYDNLKMTTKNSKFYPLLSKNNEIECIDYNKFKIGNKTIKGRNYGILIFR